MTTSPSSLPIVVDRADRRRWRQISTQVQAAVTDGALHAGDRLPSTRDLAATLGVSRTVVTTAYASLFAEGWLEGRHGSGTYVADVSPAPRAVPPRFHAIGPPQPPRRLPRPCREPGSTARRAGAGSLPSSCGPGSRGRPG